MFGGGFSAFGDDLPGDDRTGLRQFADPYRNEKYSHDGTQLPQTNHEMHMMAKLREATQLAQTLLEKIGFQLPGTKPAAAPVAGQPPVEPKV